MSTQAVLEHPMNVGRRKPSSWFPWPGHQHQHPALQAMHDDRTTGERVADQVASFGGSWPFIFMFLGLMAAWIVLNTVVLQRVAHHRAFDPYPYIALESGAIQPGRPASANHHDESEPRRCQGRHAGGAALPGDTTYG